MNLYIGIAFTHLFFNGSLALGLMVAFNYHLDPALLVSHQLSPATIGALLALLSDIF